MGVVLAAMLLPGCGRGRAGKAQEYAYVNAPQVNLRDRVAAVYNKVGIVKNGERVDVLEKSKRYVRVRTSRGEEGWVEQRYLVGQDTYDAFHQMASQNAATPIQARGVTRAETNLHVTPGRDTEHLYQMPETSKVEILKRATAEKPGAAPPPSKPGATEKDKPAGPPLEDWWLVREVVLTPAKPGTPAPEPHVGWVLARMVDLDVPLEIAQYAESQRIAAYFVLNQVDDTQDKVAKKVGQYLVEMTEPKDGQPYDYDQIRVFTWNPRRHHYETAYRERNLFGMFPTRVSQEDFGKEGTLPVFVLHLQGEDGKIQELKYKLNGPIVRKVLAPGEKAPKSAAIPHAKKPGKKVKAK